MHNLQPLNAPRDLFCFSHLRWGFVYQRPQHLLGRFAKRWRVFFMEEPLFEGSTSRMVTHLDAESGVTLVVPHLPEDLGRETQNTIQRLLLNNFLIEQDIDDFVAWYYTPMALAFSGHLTPRLTVFDCMDELSAFKNAPAEMKEREAELLNRADLVFTGGRALYEAKLGRHEDLHCFPSSVDVSHFESARRVSEEPVDQAGIPRPRAGYCGVIDERMDLALLEAVAKLRPDISFVMLGPVVKIESGSLPRLPNIHYLGSRKYSELPPYLAGWDVALMPFARNESTRFISPTKTPEYLAAGCPVVSTSILDVVRPYGLARLARIADDPAEFASAIQACIDADRSNPDWIARADQMLSQNSWDLTHGRMERLISTKMLRPVPQVRPDRSVHAIGD